MIVCFVDIGRIVDHHCWNFLNIIYDYEGDHPPKKYNCQALTHSSTSTKQYFESYVIYLVCIDGNIYK